MLKTIEQFIEDAKKVHGDKYDYSEALKFGYYGNKTKIPIICHEIDPLTGKEHGEFWQTPNGHLNGQGCPNCNKTKHDTTETFLLKAKNIHGENADDYSKVTYVNSSTPITLICPIHGEYTITPGSYLAGRRCNRCGCDRTNDKNRMSQEDFIKRANKVHNNKYDYSKVEYKNTDTKVCIICPEHGEFWQTPHHHLAGIGCPECGHNNISEEKLYNFIKQYYPDAVRYKTFKWLGRQNLDIYIPSKNIGIEYQGKGHFEPVERFGGKDGYEDTIERDNRKLTLCNENNLELLIFTYEKKHPNPNKYLKTLYLSENKLLKKLNEYDRYKPNISGVS